MRIPTRSFAKIFAWILQAVWLLGSAGSAWAQTPGLLLESRAAGLNLPVFLTHAGDARLFIVEQPGRILVMQPGSSVTGAFLDISERVLSGGEQGLLGLAFHPQYSVNERFFVNYTRQPDGATVIAEFRVASGDANAADPASEKILLIVPQPFANHNGGMIAFGPDGYLYIGMGDGGSSGDPFNYAQNNDELLGKMLRIDVDHSAGGPLPYSSPDSNPFFGPVSGRDEIFASGLRNPWRFSFDRATGQIYAGDVGQATREEIDIITSGGNYGWRVLEGSQCTTLGPASCSAPGFTGPIAEYDHSGARCSVTGGYVYRGSRSSLPSGAYLFADFCSGEIFMYRDGVVSLALDTDLNIASFGEDQSGELYIVDLGGSIHRLLLAAPATTAVIGFAAAERGGAMVVASAPEGGLKTGYARIRADSGPTPAGLAIHGIRHEGVLVSEAVVPAVQLISSGRALARIGSSTRTGIAIANPNTAPVMVAFHFTNASGQDFGRSSFVIPGGGQASHFLHEAPFHGAETPDGVLDGTLTFYASHPVAVTILSVTLGARGAPLSSVMPVASLDNTTAEATFPHWAHGGGWSTEFALVNPSDQVIRGVVEARYSDGQVRHRLLYTIAPRSSGRVSLPFQEATVRIGSARIVPAQGPAPSGAAVIRFSSGGETTTESAVAAIPSSRAFRGYGELFSGRRTGLAVANTSSSNAAVTIELTPMDGSRPSFIGMITLPPFGQRSLFLDEVPGLGAVQSFLGIVRISSPAFVVATLIRTRINERGDFLIAASPPKEESAPSFNAQLFFPLIAAGEGSETEFVLWNVRGLVPASGELMFVAPDGGPLPLSVLPVSGP